jgi:NAD(P)-dependent dehydrogenase (short-subunit alcohol dehydrogenase family)
VGDATGLEHCPAVVGHPDSDLFGREKSPENLTVPPPVLERGDLADPDQLAAINALIPMRRPATPDEIAAMMAWVASDDAGYCTGAVFTVDGGMTAI